MVPTADGCYCKTCQKQADSNANGKPTYGCVEDRQAVGLSEYRDPKGKQSVPYATVMKKLNIGKDDRVHLVRLDILHFSLGSDSDDVKGGVVFASANGALFADDCQMADNSIYAVSVRMLVWEQRVRAVMVEGVEFTCEWV